MQSLSLTLSKRLSTTTTSKPLFRISPNLVAHASSSTTTSSSSSTPSLPLSPPSSAAAAGNGASWPSSTLHSLLRIAPWSATQSRGITLSGSDVRAPNLDGNQGRAYEVLKLYRPYEGKGNAAVKVPPHSVAGYATVATTGDDIKRVERDSGLRNVGPKTKREQLLKATAAVPLLLVIPNAYTMLLANLAIFWHTSAGIEEILADYVHHEMTRNFVVIAFRLFLIIAMKDVFLKFVFE